MGIISDGSTEHLEFMSKHYPPSFTYQDFAPQFKAEFYDPYRWAEILQKSGAKFVKNIQNRYKRIFFSGT